ncbi:HepT-like ribonuclease domain-containing protein [Terriglobus roseus]|uniref:Uncharacterized conserved protein, contains HEPN domain n=1 Tax=Terriglobus roseus TaxID=392734 RepID=A0A1H4RJD0_9BACT|nr:HepT-like ribonuclease domain-containing protein [Terriglobus roseus]SEC32000.1 Uncharacterized conserved protein, contains HEPN domain [Terriglobus roseus]
MQHDDNAYFHDIVAAGNEILEYTAGMRLRDYLNDGRTRRAVERCLAIIGEALSQIRKRNESALAAIPNYQRVIGLRHLLIHEYTDINDTLIWTAVEQDLPELLKSIQTELHRIKR